MQVLIAADAVDRKWARCKTSSNRHLVLIRDRGTRHQRDQLPVVAAIERQGFHLLRVHNPRDLTRSCVHGLACSRHFNGFGDGARLQGEVHGHACIGIDVIASPYFSAEALLLCREIRTGYHIDPDARVTVDFTLKPGASPYFSPEALLLCGQTVISNREVGYYIKASGIRCNGAREPSSQIDHGDCYSGNGRTGSIHYRSGEAAGDGHLRGHGAYYRHPRSTCQHTRKN